MMSEEEKLPGVEMPELSLEQQAAVEKTRNEMWLHIFQELSKSKRFTEFVDNNYDIVNQVNEEEKTVTCMVIEKPVAVGPKMTPHQIVKLQKIVASSGATSTGETLRQILEALGQDGGSLILTNDQNISDLKQ